MLTIDPARRLAQSMGLDELDNAPRTVVGVDETGGGSLDAMMLDMKRTFDEVVVAHAAPDKAAADPGQPLLPGAVDVASPARRSTWRWRSSASCAAQDAWDLIVVDTPPSRSALDFLDAPARLGSFLDGRFIRVLTAPARAGGRAGFRLVSAGVGVFTGALTKVLGGDLLSDVQTFVAALDTMFGGFRERAEQTYRLLQDPETAFVVVAAPEPDALREAAYFVERLAADGMPLAGLVLNRVHTSEVPALTAAQSVSAADHLAESPEHSLAAASCCCTPSGCG